LRKRDVSGINARLFTTMETAVLTPQRKFLFLQGPHGPFFRQLGVKIAATGASVSRIGFNRGDAVFWMRNSGFKPFDGTSEEWPAFLENYLTREGITDIVLYGDSRPIHKTAREIAKARGITAHCFEEGYLRPYWATYERGGTNGHSVLMDLSMEDIRRAVDADSAGLPEVPVKWGSAWHHAFYGFLYHLFLSVPTRRFRNYRPHREISVLTELRHYIFKLAGMPLHGLQRRFRTRRLLVSGAIYHLVLLQLSHDASLRSHSDFKSVEEFIEKVIAEFAVGAPTHHKLVFKAHPFEDGREPLPSIVRKVAGTAGISARVLYIPGGKLGPLLDSANSTVTVNSTPRSKHCGAICRCMRWAVRSLPCPNSFPPSRWPSFLPSQMDRMRNRIIITGSSCWKPRKSAGGITRSAGGRNCCAGWSI